MNRLGRFAALSTLSAVLFTGVSIAQDDHHDNGYSRDNRRDDHHDDRSLQGGRGNWNDRDHDHYIRHDDWRRGRRLPPDYWQHARRVDDYRAHHLRRPPRGYEWREVDGNYVLAAVATGVIASIIAAAASH